MSMVIFKKNTISIFLSITYFRYINFLVTRCIICTKDIYITIANKKNLEREVKYI